MTSPVTVTLTGSYHGVTRTTSVTVNPSAPADSVSISKADYIASKGELHVEATSTNASAALNVYVDSTSAWIGPIASDGTGRYQAQFSWPSNPGTIRVTSTAGGSATSVVAAK